MPTSTLWIKPRSSSRRSSRRPRNDNPESDSSSIRGLEYESGLSFRGRVELLLELLLGFIHRVDVGIRLEIRHIVGPGLDADFRRRIEDTRLVLPSFVELFLPTLVVLGCHDRIALLPVDQIQAAINLGSGGLQAAGLL